MKKKVSHHLKKVAKSAYHKVMNPNLSTGQVVIPRKKIIWATVSIAILIILATLSYLLYKHYFLSFKTLTKLNYDGAKAQELLKNPQTLAFTRNNSLYLGSLLGQEVLLAPPQVLGQKAANFKISQSRKYIVWEAEMGVLGLDTQNQNVFLIYQGEPRQSFDLSPLADKILFLTKSEILEVNLSSGFINKRLTQLQLPNPKFHFNQIKYSPNGQLAYLRSIHEWSGEKNEDIILNLQNSQMNFLKGFSEGRSLSPLWQGNANFLAWRGNFISFALNNSSRTVIDEKTFQSLGPYAYNPQNQMLAFVTRKDKVATPSGNFTNATIFISDLNGQNIKELVSSFDKNLSKNKSGSITDVGWLNQDQLWFTFNKNYSQRDLWVINKQGKDLKKALENFDQYSLESVYMPVTNAYILY